MPKLCDVQVHINGQQIFFLKQKVLSKYCGRLKKVLNQGKIRSHVIEINDFPGGPDGFELVSRFCYNNGTIPITASNVPLLHCSALYLAMDDQMVSNNLLQQTQTFLDGIYYWKWNELVLSLKTCDLFYVYADSYGLLDKLICALLAKIAQDSDINPFTTSSSSSSSSSSSPETIKSTLPTKAWWFKDLGILPPKIIEKLVQSLGAYKRDNNNLMVTRFLLQYLKTASQSGRKSSEFRGLAETAGYGVIFAGQSQSQRAFSCRGVFWVLRIVCGFGLGRDCRVELEKLIGGMLEQATLDDLLIPGHDMGVYYDVNLVMRLVRVFVEINGSESDHALSLLKLNKVGRLIDNYLREISPDQNLKISKFLGIAECLPDSARDCFDGVYRAIDIYLESHPMITFEERSRLCRCLNYKKLSFGACKDLAKNPRIPPRIAMQALISQQTKIPSPSKDESASMTPSQIVLYDTDIFSQDKQDMRLNLERMQSRVVELEKLCREMKGQMSSLKHRNLEECKQIHSVMIASGMSDDPFLLTEFIQCLAFSQTHPIPTSLSYASILIATIHTPLPRFFNKAIQAFSNSCHPHMPLFCYATMRQNGVSPDQHTFPLLLKTFSNIQHPFLLYAHIIKFGFHFDPFVRNALISAFANSGFLHCARRVFSESSFQDVVAWTALIDGYVKNDCADEALRCFVNMRSSAGTRVDGVTIVSILRAAGMVGDVYFGRWVHGFYVEAGRVQLDAYICSALVDMYFKCGHCDDARKMFDEMPSSYRNVVSWTALINGYVQFRRFKDALLVFQDMLSHNIIPNHFTLTSVLHASAHIGGLEQGRFIHQYIDRNKVYLNSVLGTALINMYAKCGCIDEALLLFEKLPVAVKDVYTWTAIINGLAVNGEGLSSLEFFSCMLRNGVQPNEVTFIGVLSACSHGGLVDEGKRLFELMRNAYNMEPNVDHYGCMVDLLGRAGYLEDAKQMIDEMAMIMKPSAGVLGALLSACIIHKDYQMGEHVGNYLINLHPNHSGAYALLANLYSRCQNWEAAAEVRKLMKAKGLEKSAGYSWVQVDGLIHEFKAFDHSHKESSSVYWILDSILLQLKLADQTQQE
ncbi:pentatricopeptide repeat-containing protein [Senna tora]|uniref:Pentatricopeptide repeat-containing protein n=1 Tax=Senna tora TaxID=362788 RepID=A0A834WA03_9FABA|nr:pentatricopeptide repeat-containing protein [Senna tora]